MNRNKRPRLDSDAAAASDNQHAASKPQLTRACTYPSVRLLPTQSANVFVGAECKKHKIKCFVQPGQDACSKCLKSGIRCVPHNLAQKFIDEDTG